MEGYELDSSSSVLGLVVDSCEHGHYQSNLIKSGKPFDSCATISFPAETKPHVII
jgi:hypothetical protein